MIENKIGAVMVIGGGIGGIQASLDLVELGFKVYMIEESPSIGGAMAKLDKTFPTNDCSMCILAPKMVEIPRNPNITLFAYSAVEKIEGEAGNFTVTIKKRARYVDEDKCKNCGICISKCPITVPDEYNEGLSVRSAIYIPFPQAVPSLNLIDADHCLYHKKRICKLCFKRCNSQAINFEQKDMILTLDVGAIIVATGVSTTDISHLSSYGYKRFRNVVTSLEFERILNASGPFDGHIKRISDYKEPKKIVWLNCVGSRSSVINNNYCSSVCCMYSIKEAVITKEHHPNIECKIFFIDIRAVGKGFDEYYVRAKKSGIQFVKTKISILDEDPITHNVVLFYEDLETGSSIEEEFDLVVLSVGYEASTSNINFCQTLGLQLNNYNFCRTLPFKPLESTIPGIFVCGTISAPKDIPETVAEASGAAGLVSSLLHTERHKLIAEKIYPPEINVDKQEPRIGVFVCHCGINIGSVVNVPEVVAFVKNLPNVVYAEENLYTCSQDTQEKIKQAIKENQLNRIVVASCTPRTHETLFQNTIRETGLNRYLFELANIREQCSWVHMHNPKEATEKAKDLIEMSISKVRLSKAIEETYYNITPVGLVIGGGIAGITAALNLANQGYQVYLIEKENIFGGIARKVHYILGKDDPQQHLVTLIRQVMNSDRIKIHLNTTISDISGFVGNFKVSASESGNDFLLEVGIIIVATGGMEYKPVEYLYGKDDRILTQLELEQYLSHNKLQANKVVMIQCVGSRNKTRPYCSKICCTTAIKNALKLKEIQPDIDVYVLYRDIRTYGFAEESYELARKIGINFIRFTEDSLPNVSLAENHLKISTIDTFSGKTILLEPDLLVLSTAFLPSENKPLSQLLKVPLDQNGFFLEAHAKLRPIDFATEGIFLCGAAQWPKSINESIAQSIGAAARGARILAAKKIKIAAIGAIVNQELCMGCGACEMICPFSAIKVRRTEFGQKASIAPSDCKGCGTCGASCPQKAIEMRHFTDNQILKQIDSISEDQLERAV